MKASFVAAILVALIEWAMPAHAAEFHYVAAGTAAKSTCIASPGWQTTSFDERNWSTVAPDGGVCTGTRFLRWHFVVGNELDALSILTIRAHYWHGLAAYVNGVEVTRRHLDANADANALASEVQGPEFEKLFIAIHHGLLHRGDNVLAVEVHPRTLGHETQLELELEGADGAHIVLGPYLQRVSEQEAFVVFDTDLPAIAELDYGSTAAYGTRRSDSAPQIHHSLRCGGLTAATVYHYRVSLRLPSGSMVTADDAQFHTPPRAGQPLRFIVYGDVRSGHDVHGQINRSILADDPDLAIMTGDLVDRGSDQADWQRYFEIAAPLLRQVPVFPASGNHDLYHLSHGGDQFMQIFRGKTQASEDDGAYYSFDLAGVHFVALDSSHYHSEKQLAWFERDLADAEYTHARAIFVYAHEGPYSSGMHGDSAICTQSYVPIMERHHVTIFFGGHDHHYERGKVGTLDYVVSGGGGADLRPMRCSMGGSMGSSMGGGGTKRTCPARVHAIVNEHHYIVVEVLPHFIRMCPRRPDGAALEACTEFPLAKR